MTAGGERVTVSGALAAETAGASGADPGTARPGGRRPWWVWAVPFAALFTLLCLRNRFLFTGPPLRLPGAVGSPATPVATV